MLTPEFHFYRPKNFSALNELLGQFKEKNWNYVFHGGGTDIMPSLKKLYRAPDAVVSLSCIEGLTGISQNSNSEISIGAMTKLADIIQSPVLKKTYPIISETAAQIASPQIRNQATVGGNILVDNRCKYFNQSETDRGSHGACFKSGGGACHLFPNATLQSSPVCKARFVSDLAPIFILLGANLRFVGAQGERVVAIKDFYAPEGVHSSKTPKDEILKSIEIPESGNLKIGYRKLRIRKAIDFPSLGVAVGKRLVNGQLELCCCFTGVDTHPLFLEFKEKAFSSVAEMVETAASEAARSINPVKQDFFSPRYRRKMASVFLKRLVTDLG